MAPRRAPHGFDGQAHERHHWWRSLLARLAFMVGLTGVLWWMGGWTGALVSVMLWMRVFSADLVACGEWAWSQVRTLAFRPVQGRFYQFKRQHMRVEEDGLLPQRWIALDDLAKALGEPIPVSVIGRRRGDVFRELADGTYVLDEAAMLWLRTQRSARAGQLAMWVQRDVWHPARGRTRVPRA